MRMLRNTDQVENQFAGITAAHTHKDGYPSFQGQYGRVSTKSSFFFQVTQLPFISNR